MSRLLRASMLLLLLAACGGGSGKFSAPRDLENACAIVRERPQYFRAMQATERKWGVPIHVQMATIHQESKFIGNAQTPHQFALGVIPMGRQSSAYGYSQALDGTWEEYQQEQNRRSARRDRITDATDFMGWYMDQTQRRLGVPKTDAQHQYLAYHEGRTGFARQSYLAKPWLVDVAARVQNRSNMYARQLASCGRA
ncbi:lytic transglycosylase [Pseudotabrizicola sediminis]|uniref:Lytic transglycosylase n=1 Tax=Pseudotabrizicola sediminis TaxID=2486418 RepID=A0ABY2KPU2_9RHOB|nr:lytic transglycosylase [Pseudotabrizicola sediminis]TGD44669.1 lytic transglycosylase [Pseudotabrizicola sediminis]TGD67574.1 lytic transglycosylase [Tabrizicola sp. WMC-M-20]